MEDCVIYCRVSSAEQVANTSLSFQEKECRLLAERRQWKLAIEPFIEEGESAKTADRKELKRALEFCRKNHPKYFIVYKLDRFARQISDHITIREMLRRSGTELVSVTEPLEEGAAGQLMEHMFAAFNQFDNSLRAERCTNGMKEVLRKGFYPFAAPYGYYRQTAGGNLVINEKEAYFVRRAGFGLKGYTREEQ